MWRTRRALGEAKIFELERQGDLASAVLRKSFCVASSLVALGLGLLAFNGDLHCLVRRI